MTNEQARDEFNKMIAKMEEAGVDRDKVAMIEIVREYLTNDKFKSNLEEFVFDQTYTA